MDRVVRLEAVHNFRDLGGYRTADGRITRWHTLYRADALYRLSPADVETLRAIGLRTVVDLRTDKELDERGTFPIDSYPVEFHHLPVIDVTWDPAIAPDGPDALETEVSSAFLLTQYRSMLTYGEPLFAKAFHVLGVPSALPAVFHCAAGKDRTGILAGLVLAALGVPHEVVAEDYGLTRAAMDRTRAWAAIHSPEMAAAWGRVPASYLTAEPAAMEGLLAELVEQHGSIRRYVRSIGVSNALLANLEAALLVEPGGEPGVG